MSGWEKVDINELLGSAAISLGVGVVRLLMVVRDARRQIRVVDVVLEPLMAVFGGMALWALAEHADTPDLVQAVMTSLGAWGGPQTVRKLEYKLLGGTRFGDTDKPLSASQFKDSGPSQPGSRGK